MVYQNEEVEEAAKPEIQTSKFLSVSSTESSNGGLYTESKAQEGEQQPTMGDTQQPVYGEEQDDDGPKKDSAVRVAVTMVMAALLATMA